MRHWIQTFTGRAWDLEAPCASNVALLDVVHALANLCRYGGQCCRFLSVAEHSVHVARRVVHLYDQGELGGVVLPAWDAMTGRQVRARLGLAGLLHDAPEAYLGDTISPLLRLLDQQGDLLRRLHHAHRREIARWAGVSVEELAHPLVKRADLEMLETERRAVHAPEPRAWPATGVAPIPGWDLNPFDDRGVMLDLFESLRCNAGLCEHEVAGAGYGR